MFLFVHSTKVGEAKQALLFLFSRAEINKCEEVKAKAAPILWFTEDKKQQRVAHFGNGLG